MLKKCPRCTKEKLLTEDFWYVARPRKNHKKEGWQSFCKECWKDINAANKLKRKIRKETENNPYELPISNERSRRLPEPWR